MGHTTLRVFLDAIVSPAALHLACGGFISELDIRRMRCINLRDGGLRSLTELHMPVCPLQRVVIASESLRVISLGHCPSLRSVRLECPALHELTIGCQRTPDGSFVAASAGPPSAGVKQFPALSPHRHCAAPDLGGQAHIEVKAKCLRRLALCAALFDRQPFELDHSLMRSKGAGRGELSSCNWMTALVMPRLRELTLQSAAAHVDMDVLQWLLHSCPRLEGLHIGFGGAPDELDTSRPLRCAKPCRLRQLSFTDLCSWDLSGGGDGDRGLISEAGADEIESMLPSACFVPDALPTRPFLPELLAPPPSELAVLISQAAAEDSSGIGFSTRFELKPKPYRFHPLWRSWSRHFWPGVRQIGVGHWRRA